MQRHDSRVCLFDLLADDNQLAVEIVASEWLARYTSNWKLALAELYTLLAKVSFFPVVFF
jgi:hypothetical protein